MKRLCVLALLICGTGSLLMAAEPGDSTAAQRADSSGFSVLTVESALPGVRVFVDSTLVGETPVGEIRISAGTHVLRFVHPDYRNWLHAVLVDTVAVHPGDRVHEVAAFPSVLSVNSEPYAASVVWNDSVIGETPLRLAHPPASGSLSVSKPGYDTATVTLPSAGGDLDVRLHPFEFPAGGEEASLAANGSGAPLPMYLTAGVTIVGGIAAAYFKIQADDHYQDYLQTNNAAELDQVHHLDLLAGVSLAVSQVGFLSLAYFLLSR